MGEKLMTCEEWESEVHERVKQEPTWQFLGYRKALFLYDLAWEDCEEMTRDRRGRAIAEQLIRSAGSISANIEEGHGRGYGKQAIGSSPSPSALLAKAKAGTGVPGNSSPRRCSSTAWPSSTK
jgi:hypothetical protein